MTTVYVYVMDTMADWEIGYCLAELHSKRFFRKDAREISVKTVSFSYHPLKHPAELKHTASEKQAFSAC